MRRLLHAQPYPEGSEAAAQSLLGSPALTALAAAALALLFAWLLVSLVTGWSWRRKGGGDD